MPNDWRPMSDNPFPWKFKDVIILAFDQDDSRQTEVFRCICAEHGAYFSKSSGMLSLHEEGWIPFAWKEDNTPSRDDAVYPPMLTDYLTEAAQQG